MMKPRELLEKVGSSLYTAGTSSRIENQRRLFLVRFLDIILNHRNSIVSLCKGLSCCCNRSVVLVCIL